MRGMSGLAERCGCDGGGGEGQGEAVVVKHTFSFTCSDSKDTAGRLAFSGLYSCCTGSYCSHGNLVNWHPKYNKVLLDLVD